MAFAVLLSLTLIAGAVVAVVAQRRAPRAGAVSDLDAEVEANHVVVRLGGSLSALDVRTRAGADRSAAESLADAAACLRAARAELTAARSAAEYARVTRTAVEGLGHVRTARTALGLDPGPPARPRDGRGRLVPSR
jgi:hypothetical protein